MKLLRIASQDQLTGLFSNEFSEAITLPPQSKIALVNGVFAIAAKSISVPNNCIVSYTPKDGVDDVNVTVSQGYYTQESLRAYLEKNLNFALASGVMAPVCFAWKVAVDANNHISLNFSRTDAEAAALTNFKNMTISTDTPLTYTASANSSTPAVFKSFGYSDYTVLASNCSLNIQSLNSQDAGAKIHFMFGLLKNKPDSTTEGLQVSDFMYGMLYDPTDNSGTAHFIVDGTVASSSPIPNPSTLAQIKFTQGKVSFGMSSIFEKSIDWVPEGYTYGLAIKTATNKLALATLCKNPLVEQSIANSIHYMHETPYRNILHIDDSLSVGVSATKVTLKLTDSAKAVLGYDSNTLSQSLVSGSFVSNSALTSSATPTSITVELPNLGGNIESYDGVSQKRRPIVAVVPSMKQDNGVLTYEPPFPPMIDLQNKFPIQLSKLEVRLLSSIDDSEVNLDYPGCTLSFVLDHSNPQKPTD